MPKRENCRLEEVFFCGFFGGLFCRIFHKLVCYDASERVVRRYFNGRGSVRTRNRDFGNPPARSVERKAFEIFESVGECDFGISAFQQIFCAAPFENDVEFVGSESLAVVHHIREMRHENARRRFKRLLFERTDGDNRPAFRIFHFGKISLQGTSFALYENFAARRCGLPSRVFCVEEQLPV